MRSLREISITIKLKVLLMSSMEMVTLTKDPGKTTRSMEKEDMNSKRGKKSTRESGLRTQRKVNSLRPETRTDSSLRATTSIMRKMESFPSLTSRLVRKLGKKPGRMVFWPTSENDYALNINL